MKVARSRILDLAALYKRREYLLAYVARLQSDIHKLACEIQDAEDALLVEHGIELCDDVVKP